MTRPSLQRAGLASFEAPWPDKRPTTKLGGSADHLTGRSVAITGCRSALLHLALILAFFALGVGPTWAWQSAVLKKLVPGATLTILGGGLSRQEAVSVSCVVNDDTGAIEKFFVNVNFAATPADGPAGVSFRTSDTTMDVVADYEPLPPRTPLVTVHGEQEPDRSRIFGWVADLLTGSSLEVTVRVTDAVVSSFVVKGDLDNAPVKRFLEHCPSRSNEHRPLDGTDAASRR